MPEKKLDDKKTKSKHENDSEICAAFRLFAKELDEKHDRRERLIKISRDVNIESKRIIFFLHSLINSENRSSGLKTAEKRIKALIEGPLKRAAKEGDGNREGYQPLSGSLQEMLEALCLLHYMKNPNEHSLPDWKQLAEHYLEDEKSKSEFLLMISPMDFVLGVADYTGELMRQCINSLPLGEIATCFAIRDILQQLYTLYAGLYNLRNKDAYHKVNTLRCSVLKVELVCFDIKLRGSHKFIIRDDHYISNPASGDTKGSSRSDAKDVYADI